MPRTALSPVSSTSKSPHPISGTSLRTRIMRSVQFSIECGSRRCSAALTCWNQYGPVLITGTTGVSDLVARIAEIIHVRSWHDVGFGKDDRIADAPLQELAEVAQHVVLFARPVDVRP